jgi:hypothetical protein
VEAGTSPAEKVDMLRSLQDMKRPSSSVYAKQMGFYISILAFLRDEPLENKKTRE